MAISIISNLTANGFYPSANDISITVNSTNTGKCNFRYICDIYINNIKVHTSKLFPDPTTGYGFFQLERIVQDYIKTKKDLTPYTAWFNSGTDTTTPNAVFSLRCNIGEEFDPSVDCSGQVGQTLSLAQTNTAYVFEYAVDYEDFPTFNYNNYLVATASAETEFLTNSPRELDLTYNDSYTLDFISLKSLTTASWSMDVLTYNSLGQGVATYSYNPGTTMTNKRFRLACGPYDLNSIANNTIINPEVSKYEVKLRFMTSTIVSETFTFKLQQPKYFRTRIGWVGLGGSPESYTFYHRRRKGYEIERKEYNKTLQSVISNQWKYRVGDRGQSVYGIKAQEGGSVATYISQRESEWLTEMWLSHDVWIYRRPELLECQSFNDSGTSKFIIKYPEYSTTLDNIEVGDYVFLFTSVASASGRYEVIGKVDNTLELNGAFSTSVNYCGWIQRDVDWDTLPINITDAAIEIKSKLDRPIEYGFSWKTAYTKTTLR